jgi:hypothetical protein
LSVGPSNLENPPDDLTASSRTWNARVDNDGDLNENLIYAANVQSLRQETFNSLTAGVFLE